MVVPAKLSREDIDLAFALVVLLGIYFFVAVVDLAVNRSRAKRWLEYSFVLVVALAAAPVGALFDLITVSVSPDYFIYGKGLARDSTLSFEAMRFGAREGFRLGFLAAAALLVADARREGQPQLGFGRVTRALLNALAWTLSVAAVAGIAAFAVALPEPDVRWAGPPVMAQRYATTWWMHIGAYAGAIVGVTVEWLRIRKDRRRVRNDATNMPLHLTRALRTRRDN